MTRITRHYPQTPASVTLSASTLTRAAQAVTKRDQLKTINTELIAALKTAEEFVEGTINHGSIPHPQATLREIRASLMKSRDH